MLLHPTDIYAVFIIPRLRNIRKHAKAGKQKEIRSQSSLLRNLISPVSGSMLSTMASDSTR